MGKGRSVIGPHKPRKNHPYSDKKYHKGQGNLKNLNQQIVCEIWVELINFTKEESALKSDLEGWLFVMKNVSKLNKIPLYLRKPVFEKLFNIAEYSKLNKKEKVMYDANLKRKWDNQAALDYARHEGMEKGMEKGREEFVRNLLVQTDFTISKIALLANVTEAFVRKVKKEKK